MNHIKYSQQEYIDKRRKAQRSAAIAHCAIFGASAAIGLYVVAKVAAWIVGALV